jgi:hypothetical protein
MIKLTSSIKKILIVFLLLVCGVLLNVAQAQNLKLKVSKDSTIINGIKYFSITLKIYEGTAPFNIAVFKGKPGKDENLIQNYESYNLSELKINNISNRGTYYIAISSVNNGYGKLIHLSL